jgi:TonB family protein
MLPSTNPRPRGQQGIATASQRERQRWSAVLHRSLLAAAMLHAGVFYLWPEFEVAARLSPPREVSHMLPLPRTSAVDLPRAPGEITPPALPTVEDLDLDLSEVLPSLVLPAFSDLFVAELPSPPLASVEDEWASYHAFSPLMVRPEIHNRREIKRFLDQRYAPVLRATGATGVVQVLFWIDESGIAQRAKVAVSSGSDVLDRLAMEVGQIAQFRPALRLGEPVRVQVVMPVRFESRAVF